MSVYHDEIEIEDFEYDEELETYFYPCPCGDRFEINKVILAKSHVRPSVQTDSLEQLAAGEEVATCPSCSLIVKVIYDQDKFRLAEDEVESLPSSIEGLKLKDTA